MEQNARELRHHHLALCQSAANPDPIHLPRMSPNKSPQSTGTGPGDKGLRLAPSSIKSHPKRPTRLRRRLLKRRIVARRELPVAKEMVSELFHQNYNPHYLRRKQIPKMRLVLQPRPHHPSLKLHRQALIPQHPKSPLLRGHQPANPAGLPHAVVALDEINTPKTETPMATVMPGTWRTRRAEANPTRLAQTPHASDTE